MQEAIQVVETLTAHHISLAFAESCTGGLLTKLITDVPGASAVLHGGVCAYANEVKRDVLGVPQRLLEQYGAVSRPVALHMARGAQRVLNAEVALSTTGIAGPASDDTKKPVGLVYIGLALPRGRYIVRELHLTGDRDAIRTETARQALSLLLEQKAFLEEVVPF